LASDHFICVIRFLRTSSRTRDFGEMVLGSSFQPVLFGHDEEKWKCCPSSATFTKPHSAPWLIIN